MKKFTLKGVLDGLRSSVSTPPKAEVEIEETLRSDHFQVRKTVRHGFPYQPTALAFDPVQHILAVGTKNGSLRIFGRPGVDCQTHHNEEMPVNQILFLVNEGALVTCCADDTLHLWNLRQKLPEIVHTLKFQRERLTCCHLPFQSKWLYIGSERGNVHVVNIESFSLSGYVINWNKAIELSRKTHPGQVVNLSDNPLDKNKLLIGFDSGTVVLWDLKSKTADQRFCTPEALRSISWHHEGKTFMCSHSDGSLSTWNSKISQKPASIVFPHAKVGKDGKCDPCKPIAKVVWKSLRNGESLIIFSGGMSYDRAGRTPSITVMNGKSTTVLEMEHNVVDFAVLCDSPWQHDFQDPYAIVVLLQNDLVVVDLTTPGYPCFENPYPMDIHESPVTACQYYADCPPDLIPAFYSVGSKQKRTGFSEQCWPIKGGEWGTTTCSYPEIILTGHADGSVKFWDASAVTLQVLYKLKTAKLFERPKKPPDGQDDDPFAIQMIHLCLESRMLLVAGATNVMLFKFVKQELTLEVPEPKISTADTCFIEQTHSEFQPTSLLEISIVFYEVYDDSDSAEFEYPSKPTLSTVSQHSSSVGSYSSNTSDNAKSESTTSLKIRTGARKWGNGYCPEIVCLLLWVDGEAPGNVTAISVNSTYGLMAFGNESGLAIVDYIQKTCLLNLGTPDLYGSMDPYQRAPRSPRGKKPQPTENLNQGFNVDECRSPTNQTDQPSPSGDSITPNVKKKLSDSTLFSIKEDGSSDVETKLNIEIGGDSSHGDDVSPVLSVGDDGYNQCFLSQSDNNNNDKINTMTENENSPIYEQPLSPYNETKELNFNEQLGISENDLEHLHNVSKQKVSKTLSDPEKYADDVDEGQKLVTETKHRKSKVSLPFLKHHHKARARSKSPGLRVESPNEDDASSSQNKSMKVSESCPNIKSNLTAHEIMELEQNISEMDDLVDADQADAASKEKKGFLRRMSLKLQHFTDKSKPDGKIDDELLHKPQIKHKKSSEQLMVKVLDLSDENAKVSKRRYSMMEIRSGKMFDKNDGTSFSRSRSSSMSSLENVSKEAIQSLIFSDSYTRKTDNFTSPCLWVGTSLGSVLVIVLNLPPAGDQRSVQPVIVSPSGTIFRLKGAILSMSFLDCNGVLIPTLSDPWKDAIRENKDEKPEKSDKTLKASSRQMSMPVKPKISPTSSTEVIDRQFVIICSEKQARAMSLPSQTCAYKVKITESSFVVKAEIVALRDSVCLACYVANGHITTFSLPSLKPLIDVDFLPLTDYRVARTFCFSNNGHALYFCSPTEVQKITYSADICESLNEMLGDLFLPCETPEAPKQSFFKNLFGGGPSALDREELFGEASGKASRGLAKRIPGSGLQQAQASAGGAMSEVSRARELLSERGEKLEDTELRTAQLAATSENFADTAHRVMMKYKDKKWYQF